MYYDIHTYFYAFTSNGDYKVNQEKLEKFNLLTTTLNNDFSNENLHSVLIDYCIENDIEFELIKFYKSKSEQYPEICNKMLETLSDRSITYLYNNKIKTKTDKEGKKTAIKLILILIFTIIALFFIWKGLLSSFKGSLLQ